MIFGYEMKFDDNSFFFGIIKNKPQQSNSHGIEIIDQD
jgi:hypothetical protein